MRKLIWSVMNLYGEPDVPEWGTDTMTKLFDKIQGDRLHVNPIVLNISATAADFLRKLLAKDANDRPSFKSCLEHALLDVSSSEPPAPGLSNTPKENVEVFRH